MKNKRIVQYAMFTFMLVIISNLPLYASSFSTFKTSLDLSNQFVLAEEDEQEKVVTNVKVFFNPIAQQISVSLKINQQNTVIIKVMDALGNEVLALMNGALEVGNQNLSFDTNDKLTTGFYFVRVSVGTETVVKRISVR